MNVNFSISRCLLIALVVFTGGCMSPQMKAVSARPPASQKKPQTPQTPLSEAEALFEVGNYNAALLACAEISTTHPQTPGLKEFRQKVLGTIQKKEAEEARESLELDRQRTAMETLEAAKLPDRYGLKGTTEPLPMDQLNPESPMRQQLNQPISLSLQDAPLSALIEALSDNLGISIIADQDLGAEKRMTIEAENLPLQEVLHYASRNLGVEFHAGENVLWVTKADAETTPLESRIYRLRQGIQMSATDWLIDEKDAKRPINDIDLLTKKAAVPSTKPISIEHIITNMVPEQPGAALYFDRGTHTLFVRNSRENLKLIESIVQALDTTPPQVLIEARFIEVVVDDLSELGIEWLLNSPWSLKSKGVLGDDGTWSDENKVQIAGNTDARRAGIAYTPYTTYEGGVHPLGPQGAFGLKGSPETAGQGLSLALQGVLTDPMFEATLHALNVSGKGRTLSMPRVTTMNNNPAKLRSGSDLRFFEEFQAQAFSLVDSDNKKYTITALIPKGTPSIEELGITLVAVPSVGADRKKITLLLNPSISDLDGWVNYQSEQADKIDVQKIVVKLPTFTRQEVATKLTVQSGETVVMGGLIKSIEQDTVHKIPLLGDLPLLGVLFRRTGVTEQRRNLLIFVTATVISDRGESLFSVAESETETPLRP